MVRLGDFIQQGCNSCFIGHDMLPRGSTQFRSASRLCGTRRVSLARAHHGKRLQQLENQKHELATLHDRSMQPAPWRGLPWRGDSVALGVSGSASERASARLVP
jgi:hypothetical protein